MTKSTTVPKKSPTKKTQITDGHTLTRREVLVLALLAVLLATFMVALWRQVPRADVKFDQTSQSRLKEINDIYGSLKLDNTYVVKSENVFGEKRVYDYDNGRTFASEMVYGHDAAPVVTRADLRSKVEAAGFTWVQTEYEGSIQPIDEFKNSKGNYVRVGVTSKFVAEAMTETSDLNDPLINHSNDSPSVASVKVNLDDNNE